MAAPTSVRPHYGSSDPYVVQVKTELTDMGYLADSLPDEKIKQIHDKWKLWIGGKVNAMGDIMNSWRVKTPVHGATSATLLGAADVQDQPVAVIASRSDQQQQKQSSDSKSNLGYDGKGSLLSVPALSMTESMDIWSVNHRSVLFHEFVRMFLHHGWLLPASSASDKPTPIQIRGEPWHKNFKFPAHKVYVCPGPHASFCLFDAAHVLFLLFVAVCYLCANNNNNNSVLDCHEQKHHSSSSVSCC